MYLYREALRDVAHTNIHTTSVQHHIDYIAHLKTYGSLQEPIEVTEEAAINGQATAALEVLSAWWSQANLQKATLETNKRDKGGQKYEQQCTQLLGIVARL